MATHSSVLAWRIPGMGEPGGLLSMGLHRIGRLKRLSKQMWNTYTMEYHSEIKRNTRSRQPTTRRGIKNVSLSGRSQKSKNSNCESLFLWCPNWHVYTTIYNMLPWWLSRLRICLQCRRPRFNPWAEKIPWRRKWQPTPVSLFKYSHGLRSLGGFSPKGHTESDTTE